MSWIRLDCSTLMDDWIYSLKPEEFKAWILFLLTVKSVGSRGTLAVTSAQSLARQLKVSAKTVKSLLHKSNGRIIEEDGRWRVKNWWKYQEEHRDAKHKRIAPNSLGAGTPIAGSPEKGDISDDPATPTTTTLTTTPTTTEKTGGEAKTPQAASPARLFLTWYGQEFLSRSGAKYMCTFNVETQLVKQMLADFGEDELRRRAVLFLDDTDPWLDKAGRTIKILRSRINSYVPTQPPPFGGMPPPPPDPSCRPGKKFEPVDENSEAYRRYRRLYHGEK